MPTGDIDDKASQTLTGRSRLITLASSDAKPAEKQLVPVMARSNFVMKFSYCGEPLTVTVTKAVDNLKPRIDTDETRIDTKRPPSSGSYYLRSFMRSAVSSAIISLVVAHAFAEDWPCWRGPTGMGQSTEKDLPVEWGGKDGKNIAWKMPLLPGTEKVRFDQNQSSPIVKGDRVYVTLSYWLAGAAAEKESPEHHVICFAAKDGERVWDTKVPAGPWKLTDLRGGYTAPTPSADGDHIYILFGSSVAAAIDRDGKIVWRKEITPHAFDVAMGVQSVLYKDLVLVEGPDQQNLALIASTKRLATSNGRSNAPSRLGSQHADAGRGQRRRSSGRGANALEESIQQMEKHSDVPGRFANWRHGLPVLAGGIVRR